MRPMLRYGTDRDRVTYGARYRIADEPGPSKCRACYGTRKEAMTARPCAQCSSLEARVYGRTIRDHKILVLWLTGRERDRFARIAVDRLSLPDRDTHESHVDECERRADADERYHERMR